MAAPHGLTGGLAPRAAARLAGVLLLVVVVLCAVAAAGIRPFGALDRAAATSAGPWADDVGLGPAAAAVSLGGGPFPVIVAGFVVAALLALRQHRRREPPPWGAVVLLALGPLLAWLVDALLKLLVTAPRPALVEALAEADGYGMPSGHSTVSAALAAALVLALLPHARREALRAVLVVAAGALALLDGLSRVLLGVHWVSDVIAGWCLGIGVVLLLGVALPRRRVPGQA